MPLYLIHHRHRTDPPGSPPGPEITLEAFRGPGPGGQHRNKTSSTIRATHVETGLSAIANDSRDQSRNKTLALTRLRHLLTVQCRKRIYLDRPDPPPEFNLAAGPKSSAYLPTLGHALDVLAATGFVLSQAAEHLGITTAQLSAFLTADEEALAYINRERAGQSLKPLRPR